MKGRHHEKNNRKKPADDESALQQGDEGRVLGSGGSAANRQALNAERV